MRHLVTGGAGFIGSHIVERLLKKSHEVICVDDLSTGNKLNLKYSSTNDSSSFTFIDHDIIKPLGFDSAIDQIWHFACPASPIQYQKDPIKTARTNFLGTYNMLELAKEHQARILLASTSEVYGDPEVHPQPESYRGCVNPIGVRACYDEGKRIAETLAFDYFRQYDVDIGVARIFNTYGPRMSPEDGRVVSNFIVQALKNEPLTINGDGQQTRSFCYIDDLVEGLFRLMESGVVGPLNLGNNEEFTVRELAAIVKYKINRGLSLTFNQMPPDDPKKRQPSIWAAEKLLNWKATTSLEDGVEKTAQYFLDCLDLKS